MKIDLPGVYQISHADYHADPAPVPSLSRSTITDLLYASPAHAAFNHPRLNAQFKPSDDEKFDLGTAAHELLLAPADNIVVVEASDWRTKEARAEREKARMQGKTPLLREQWEAAQKMVKSVAEQIQGCKELGIDSFVADGQTELSFFWQEEETWLRVRPDWIREDSLLVLDYKTTTGSANPEDIARTIVSMGYDIQAAFYIRGVKAVKGVEPKFIFVFQETREPYLCSFVGLPPEFMEMAKQKVEYGIFLWRECMRNNYWPGYPQQVAWVMPPTWALASWEQRAQNIGV